jgi:hypothetical protein
LHQQKPRSFKASTPPRAAATIQALLVELDFYLVCNAEQLVGNSFDVGIYIVESKISLSMFDEVNGKEEFTYFVQVRAPKV